MFPCLCKEEVRGWRPVALAALPPTPHLGPATSGHLPPLATSGHLGRLGEALWWRTRSAVPPPLPPATDHLLGSYVPTAEWQPKMRPLPANAQTRGPVVAPANVPQLPTREEYEATRRLQRHRCERRLCTAAPLGRRRGCCRGRCASRPAAAAARRRRQSQTGARSLRTPTASDLWTERARLPHRAVQPCASAAHSPCSHSRASRAPPRAHDAHPAHSGDTRSASSSPGCRRRVSPACARGAPQPGGLRCSVVNGHTSAPAAPAASGSYYLQHQKRSHPRDVTRVS